MFYIFFSLTLEWPSCVKTQKESNIRSIYLLEIYQLLISILVIVEEKVIFFNLS